MLFQEETHKKTSVTPEKHGKNI